MMLNPYAILAAVLLFVASVTGAYFYGDNIGYQRRQAQEVDTLGKQFSGYVSAAGDAAKAGTAAALKDFQDKAAVLESVAKNLRSAEGIMDNAASKLSASLRGGSCVLDPDQRRLLECIRRPGDSACAAAAP